MSTEKKSTEPLSFSFTEAEIGNACRAAIVNRLRDDNLAAAPFKVEVQAGGVYTDKVGVTVTFWPKRVRKPRERNATERMPGSGDVNAPENLPDVDRRSFVGGSDIPKIIGVSEYGDEFSLYLEKTGELDPPAGESKVQRRGKLLEPVIIEMYRDEFPAARIVQGETFRMKGAPHFRAQVDAIEATSNAEAPLEIKSASEWTRGKWGPSGTDDAPTSYCAQLHWQMMLTGAPFGRIVALLGADDLRVYTLERDPKVDEFLLERATAFWQRVQERRPPTANFDHPSIGDTLARLFSKPNATEILQADDKLRAWRDVYVEAGEQVKAYEAVKEGAKEHLLAAMRNAGIIDFGDGQMFERKSVTRKGYTVESTIYIDGRLKKSKAGGLPALTHQEEAA